MNADVSFMRLALRLGRKGLGRTSPNPAVGAVVVAGDTVVGRGYHRQAGGPHAEAAALDAAGDRAAGGTLYVTLEPCNHHGRTPPCTDAILAAGIRRVVLGVRDPNPQVRGKGATRLRRRGVEVVIGVEEEACIDLITAFSKHTRTGRPYVTLKLAASLDGRIATSSGASRWITGEKARRTVHRWRNEVDAIMVGAETVRVDDPALTCRIRGGRDPLRVIVDGRLRIPLGARVLTNGAATGTLVATVTRKTRMIETLRKRGAEVLVLPGRNGQLSLRRLLRELGRRGVMSVLIEGGANLAAAALRERVVDRFQCFFAPLLIGADGRPMVGPLGVLDPSRALSVRNLRVSRLGDDFLMGATLGDSRVV